jgi:hypothetical protein
MAIPAGGSAVIDPTTAVVTGLGRVTVPAQRSGGTVYGGETGVPTSANVDAPLELSGSLTGLILSRGQSAQIDQTERKSRLVKVLGIGIGALLLVLVLGLVGAVIAGGAIHGFFRAVTGH